MTTTFKPMTDAFRKVDEYRDLMNKGREKIQAKDFSSTVYLYTSTKTSKPCAIGYSGRSKNNAFHYSFSSIERREESINEFIEGQQSRKQYRSKVERNLVVGDVLYTSWGYEQTNVEFYKVISLVGKLSVEIVEIGRETIDDSSMSGSCIPSLEVIIGEPMRKRVNRYGVTINSSVTAHKLEPEIIHGCKIYPAKHFSSYH